MSGVVEQMTSYHPFGATLGNSGTVNVPYKFTGQELDGTGLYDYHARLYDPVLGRFISADTIVPDPSNAQSLNRYSYVLNNPLRFADPSGHEGVDLTLPVIHCCPDPFGSFNNQFSLPAGFAPYQFPVGVTPSGGGIYVAVTQGPSLWNAYVGLVGKRIQSLNSQGADPDFINSEFKRYMGYDLFPADILALGQPAASSPLSAPQATGAPSASGAVSTRSDTANPSNALFAFNLFGQKFEVLGLSLSFHTIQYQFLPSNSWPGLSVSAQQLWPGFTFGVSVDGAVNRPGGESLNPSIGLGRNLSAGTFFYPNPNFGPDSSQNVLQQGLSVQFGPSIGFPYQVNVNR